MPASETAITHLPLGFADINIELNGLISFPVIPLVQLPPCGHLLTTVVAREDIKMLERRFYPYLWFPGCPPHRLELQDYSNILGPPLLGPMLQALQKTGLNCGTLALTASHQLVLFFKSEDKKAVLDALVKSKGLSYSNNARWQGEMGIPVQNNAVTFMGHHIQQDSQVGSGSNVSQSSTGQPTKQYPQSGSSLHSPPSDPTRIITVQPQSQDTVSHYRSSVHSETVEQNGPPMSYPTNAVFAETHTKESFPHPQNTNAVALRKKKTKGRAAKSRGQRKNARIKAPEPEEPVIEPVHSVSPQQDSNNNFTDQEISDFINASQQNFVYNDNAQQAFYLQPQDVPGFSGPLAGDSTGPFNSQSWNLESF